MRLKFVTLEKEHVEPLIPLVFDSFFNYEPMTKTVGISANDFSFFVRIIIEKAADEGLSIVGIDEESDDIVSFSISDDLCGPPPAKIDQVSVKMQPIFSLLEELDQFYKEQDLFCHTYSVHFHLFMIGVRTNLSMKNITTETTHRNLELAKKKGYQYALTEATGSASQKIFSKLGFQEMLSIHYKEFLYNGFNVFNSIKDHQFCKLMMKRV